MEVGFQWVSPHICWAQLEKFAEEKGAPERSLETPTLSYPRVVFTLKAPKQGTDARRKSRDPNWVSATCMQSQHSEPWSGGVFQVWCQPGLHREGCLLKSKQRTGQWTLWERMPAVSNLTTWIQSPAPIPSEERTDFYKLVSALHRSSVARVCPCTCTLT